MQRSSAESAETCSVTLLCSLSTLFLPFCPFYFQGFLSLTSLTPGLSRYTRRFLPLSKRGQQNRQRSRPLSCSVWDDGRVLPGTQTLFLCSALQRLPLSFLLCHRGTGSELGKSQWLLLLKVVAPVWERIFVS
jgi:hypothetical protein